MTNPHPNATAAASTTGVAAVIVFGLGLLGIVVPPEIAVVGAGLLISAVLLVGRRGLKGIASVVWRGDNKESDV